MTTDTLTACRKRWRDVPPPSHDELKEALDEADEACISLRMPWMNTQTAHTVAEVLRLRDENARLTAMIEHGHTHEWIAVRDGWDSARCIGCDDVERVEPWEKAP